MVTQDNFRGIAVEIWPVDGIKHDLILPSMAHRHEPLEGLARANLGGRIDQALLKHYIEQVELSMRNPTLKLSMSIKCDRIERHTAEFHLKAGRDYLKKHPMLKRSMVSEVKVFWRTIYLVSGSARFAISRTNWKETVDYHVSADREFTFARRVVEPMQSIMRHPLLLPIGTPNNVVFARKAKQAIIPIEESWWPEGVIVSEYIKHTNSLMKQDFTVKPTYKDYDIYEALEKHFGITNPPCELKAYKSLTGQGKGVVRKIERQYGKPVFQARSAAWFAASRYDGFDKKHSQLEDTWEYCFRTQADGFIPKLSKDIAQCLFMPRAGDTSAWRYEPGNLGSEIVYTDPSPHGNEDSPRLTAIIHDGLDSGWRKEIARLKEIIDQSQK